MSFCTLTSTPQDYSFAAHYCTEVNDVDFSLIVKDFPVVLWCQQTIKKRRCQDCTTFERFPWGAATTVTPAWTGPWMSTLAQLDIESGGFTADCGHLS